MSVTAFEETGFKDALLRSKSAPFDWPQESRKQFLVREPAIIRDRMAGDTRNDSQESARSQVLQQADALVRLPSVRESQWRVNVLQRWVGRVESVGSTTFKAVIYDATDPTNPQEEVELDGEEVSPSDIPLLCEGATFYWAIGYRQTPGGQRERVSTLRFARLPKLTQAEIGQILHRADDTVDVLERD